MAAVAALAAGLASMVVRLSAGRPSYQQHDRLHGEAVSVSEDARARFLGLADDDSAAYSAYRAARALPRESESERVARDAASRQAARGAAEVPLAMVRECHGLIDLVERLAGRTNPNASSDLEVASLLLEAAARGAASNVRVNLDAVADPAYADAVRAELDQRLQRVQSACDRTRETIARGVARGVEGA